MRKPAASVFIAIWVAGFFLATPETLALPALRISYPTFVPFHSRDAHGNMTGFFYDIINEAVERRMGIPVAWKAYPWPRCQTNLKSGQADAILTVPTVERAAYSVTHEKPFFLKELNVFTTVDHKKLNEIKSIRDIIDIKKGGFTVITYTGNGWHKENVGSLGIRSYETAILKSVWKMLAAGRGDIVIEWSYSAWPDIREAGLAHRIVQTPVVLAAMPFHLLVGKASPHTGLLCEFDAVIEEMQADGTMEKILARYR